MIQQPVWVRRKNSVEYIWKPQEKCKPEHTTQTLQILLLKEKITQNVVGCAHTGLSVSLVLGVHQIWVGYIV